MTTSKVFIREFSDLHLEFYYDLFDSTVGRAKEEISKLIPPLPTDKKTVLIIAGDLATALRANRAVTFFEFIVPRFKHVIYILGNHEHYGCNINESEEIIRVALAASSRIDMTKMTIAGNTPSSINIKGITFLCGTLWTDYNGGDLETSRLVSRCINDHRTIYGRIGGRFTTEDAREIHATTLASFDTQFEKLDAAKTVVVTHHMPSFQAVAPEYLFGDSTTRTLNAAFASNLDEFILKHQPAYWFFGHTHTKYDGLIGKTRLICNPLGYPNEANVTRGVFDTSTVYSL